MPIIYRPQAFSSRTFLGLTTLVAVIGAWFGFTNPILHLPLLIFLFPMALAFTAYTSVSHAQAGKRGWIIGMAVSTSCLYWVIIPVHQYGHIPLMLALPCPFLLGSFLGLYASVYTLALFHLRSRLAWPLLGLFSGTLWASLEILQGWLLTGFPWLTLPSALSIWPEAIQTVRYVGSYGLAGVMAMVALWGVQGFWKKQTMGGIILVLGLCALPAVFPSPQPHKGKPVRTIIVQGNINQDHKWDPAFQHTTVNTYDRLSRLNARDNATDLIVWPETAMPFYFQEETAFRLQIASLVRDKNIVLITGAPGYTLTPKTSPPGYKLYNRAFLVTPEGRCTTWYDKRHLVPFGEYVPFGNLIPMIRKIVIGTTDFSPGQTSTPLRYKNLALGTLICYEAIFPDLAQEDVNNGATILVNISNDTWFGRSSAPAQHLNISVLRAAEQNRYLIRSTNTGISAFVDNYGHILNTSLLFKEQALLWDTVYPMTETTFYHRHYTVIHCGFPIIALLIGLPAWFRRNKRAIFTGTQTAGQSAAFFT
ncbi:MAG: apolipoprotein N-acyltransferase [Desulfoplanes sp.]|nr:apolipoprotein N-acyltransferase [Desulfoplanes sp.]